MPRTQPNIIITGTPGVGKSSLAELVAQQTGLKHLKINDLVKEGEFHEGWDKELETWVVDEDKLLDALEPLLLPGGNIIDYHACDLFPTSWIDLVVVLRTSTEILYDRLKARGYAERKLQENMDAEIMQVILEEAREGFEEECVVELGSDGVEEMEGNAERVREWVESWREGKGKEGGKEEGKGDGKEKEVKS
ncbi:factor activating pos9 [Trapelia coarctata]|nr:factor activating pos9 [Trapelia coarctata]